ncbi:type II toxin-antitoxin system VapB family antitoxin [Actinoplanes palleronii]|uniref:type II toxin-antitoxin system VapB family antitoxin n=1 Tax=Actinoplanes palleronii TaxID=113570 RepID=UPI0031DD3E0E
MEAKTEIVRIDINDETLIEAAKILGTKSAAETVLAALREVVDMQRRVEAMESLAEMGARGDFDDFLDKRSYRR